MATKLDIPKCFVCGDVEKKGDKWTSPAIVDMTTGKHVHYSCMEKRREELNHKLEFEPCCKAMGEVAGYKISIDIFTETFAVYNPDNDMKYYFTGIKYCPFCGKRLEK